MSRVQVRPWSTQGEKNNQDVPRETSVLKAISPMLRFLRYTGVTVPIPCERLSDTKLLFYKAWSVGFFIMTMLFIIRQIVFSVTVVMSEDKRDQSWPLHVTFYIWELSVALVSPVFLLQTWVEGSCFNKAFVHVARYEEKYGTSKEDNAKEQRVVWRVTTFAAMFLFIVTAILVAVTVIPKSQRNFELLIWPLSTDYALAFFPVMYHMNSITMFSVLLLAALCWLFQNRFQRLNADVHVLCGKNEIQGAIAQIRERFNLLAAALAAMDRFLGKIIGISLVCVIPFACFSLYRLLLVVKQGGSMVETGMVCNWVVVDIFLVTVLLVSGAWLHEVIHGLKYILYSKLQASGGRQQWSLSQKVELMMLMDQLNDEEVGVSTFGLYTVTKDTVLTIFSVYLTYIVLTLQML